VKGTINMRYSATLVATLTLCFAIGGCDSTDDTNTTDSLAATTTAISAPSTAVPDARHTVLNRVLVPALGGTLLMAGRPRSGTLRER
jgi:hypothetical protein